MISNNQDEVAKRARETSPAELAEQAEEARLNAENDERLSRIDTLTPAELVLTTAPRYGSDYTSKGWQQKYDLALKVERLKSALEDELSYARVIARRGQFPDASWPRYQSTVPSGEQDPRREEWRNEVWRMACAARKKVETLDLNDKRPDDPAKFAESVADSLAAFVKSVNMLRDEAAAR